jgi:guanyl-specific ribonuclease Sa
MYEQVVEEIVQSGPYIGNKVGVRFMNNEIKMTLNKTNNHRLQKDNFEPIEDCQ